MEVIAFDFHATANDAMRSRPQARDQGTLIRGEYHSAPTFYRLAERLSWLGNLSQSS